MTKYLGFWLVGAVVVGVGLAVWVTQVRVPVPIANEPEATAATDTATVPAPEATTPTRETIRLTFVGDSMLDRSVYRKMSASGIDYPFRLLGDVFDGADLVIGNLEGPITARGNHAVPNGSLLFKFEPETAVALKEAGFDYVSLANNHTYNQGVAGLTDSQTHLAAAGVVAFGHPRQVSMSDVALVELKGWKLALVGWNMIEVTDTYQDELEAIIQQLDATVDQVVIMPHWGPEYKPQTAAQVETAHALIDAGADLIIGAHPHTVQGIEIYNNRPIFYSLGNFIFDQYWSDPTEQGLAVRVTLSDTSFTAELVPIDLRDSQPRVAAEPIRTTILERLLDASDAVTESILNQVRTESTFSVP